MWSLGAGLLSLVGSCVGEAPTGPKYCAQLAGCGLQCCDARRRCQEIVCQGVSWTCRLGSAGYGWFRDSRSCSLDGSTGRDGPGRDGAPGRDGPVDVRSAVDRRQSVDQLTRPDLGKCSVVNCAPCKAGYCGPNAECRDQRKCRCINGNWKNGDGDWENGCEQRTTGCSPTNCNNCYVGYCGANANCNRNKCVCTVSGASNCDGQWERSGCECKGTCSGGKCL